MKRYIKFITVITCIMIIFLSYVSNANTLIMELVFDDKVINYEAEEVKLVLDGETVITKEMPPIILDERTLVPAREMFEQMGASVTWYQDTKKVFITFENSQVELTINSDEALVTIDTNTTRYTLDVVATIINNKTMIPLRFVSEALNFNVDWDNDTRTVNIETKKEEIEESEDIEDTIIEDDEQTAEGLFNNEKIDIKQSNFEWNSDSKLMQLQDKEDLIIERKSNSICDILDIDSDIDDEEANITITASGKITDVKVSEWDGKLVLDIENSMNEVEGSVIPDENIFVSAIRTSQFTQDSTRVVLDLIDSKNYYVTLSEDRKEININIFKNEIYKIKLTEKKNISTFEIYSIGKINYDSFRMTENDRVIVDILGSTSKLGYKTAEIKNSSNISKIRTSPFEEDITRFVFDTDGQRNYEVIQDENENKIIINILHTGYKNLTYYNNDEYVLKIENDIDIDVEDIEIEEDYIKKEYIITLPDELEDILGEGNLLVEDSRIERLETYYDNKDRQVIKIYANSIIAIKPSNKGNDIMFEILRPGEKYERVLVIDPGHGDTDPGANVGKYLEKNYNLEISLKVKEYLEENTDIKVYMTREDDSYPSLRERAELANTIIADMYISIHNNAMDKKTWNGTEVLYNNTVTYLNGKTSVKNLNNKLLAQTLSEQIVDKLGGKYKNNGTSERNGTDIKDGISLRTDLAVLKLAKMPASLIELAFMTNEKDLANLNNPEYINEASNAIAEIIEDIFNDYDL